MTREKGCTTTELSSLLNLPSSKLYSAVDKTVAIGTVVKRYILPRDFGGKDPECRILSRTSILHLKRFSSQYNNELDKVDYEGDDRKKQSIILYFKKLLYYHNVNQMSSTDVSRSLGINPRNLVKCKHQINREVKEGKGV